jgi:hypothetical protein
MMVVVLAAFLFPLIALAADGPPVDLVLLLQDSANAYAQRTDLQALQAGDRVAVMTFGGKATLRLPLSGDHAKAAKIIRAPRNRFGLRLGAGPGENRTALWDAVTDACDVFADAPDPARRRVIIVLFTDEDKSPHTNFDTVRKALTKAGATLSASVVPREEQLRANDRAAQTPPITGPAGKPIETRRRALPEATIQSVQKLAAETHGSVILEDWDLTTLLHQIRTR